MRKLGLVSVQILALLALSTSATLSDGRPTAGCPRGFIDGPDAGGAFDFGSALEYKGELPPLALAYFTVYLATTDRNGDGLVCMKDLPDTPGLPSFITQLMDNVASS